MCACAGTAEAGDLTFMTGGHPRATEAVTPLLKQMGKDVIYCGKHGAGAFRVVLHGWRRSGVESAVLELKGLCQACSHRKARRSAARCFRTGMKRLCVSVWCKKLQACLRRPRAHRFLGCMVC